MDKKDGLGWMKWLNIRESYLGYYKKNVKDGFGYYEWNEEKGKMKQYRNRYIGFWQNGRKHGLGMFIYSNGDIYIGEWKNDKKSGFGIYIGKINEIITVFGMKQFSMITKRSLR